MAESIVGKLESFDFVISVIVTKNVKNVVIYSFIHDYVDKNVK